MILLFVICLAILLTIRENNRIRDLLKNAADLHKVKKRWRFSSLAIKSQFLSIVNRLSGSMSIPKGRVSVSYEKEESQIAVKVNIPAGVKAVFIIPLESGENAILVK